MRPRRRDLLALAAATGPAALLRPGRAFAAPATPAAPGLITVEVDAREAPRRIQRVRMTFPIASPGAFSLCYPKWLPGEHGPFGPINDVVGLQLEVAGKTLAWQRDLESPYEIHCELPAGARALAVSFDFVTGAGGRGAGAPATASEQLVIVKWNQVVLYPKGADPRALRMQPGLRLPAGWAVASALEIESRTPAGRAGAPNDVRFRPVTLETLVDSPVTAGRYFRAIDLSPSGGPPHELDLFADSAEALAIKDAHTEGLRRLVVEAHRLFGAWPYRRYRFLWALSDAVPHGGLEHHECSDNRSLERTVVEDAPWALRAGLLPHEMVHAWNGKHRRPAGLATRDFQEAMKTDLLWIYEGLTTYLGEVLTARAGLRSAENARGALAYSAATQDAYPGRLWRPLADTAASAPVLSHATREWRSLRRGLDYYPESQLIWLEADEIIRGETGGRRSLDDFCRGFCGRTANGAPAVVPYVLDDVLAALTEVCPYAWREFFQTRVYATAPHPPLRALESAGWKLVYAAEPTPFFKHVEEATKEMDFTFSLGLVIKDDGTILDVVEGRPAARAGVAPAGKLIAANGRKFTKEALRTAVGASAAHAGVELLVENDGFFRSHRLAWTGGHRYPTLARDEKKPDLLAAIWAPAPPA